MAERDVKDHKYAHLEPVVPFHEVLSITRGCATLIHRGGGWLRPQSVQSKRLMFIYLVYISLKKNCWEAYPVYPVPASHHLLFASNTQNQAILEGTLQVWISCHNLDASRKLARHIFTSTFIEKKQQKMTSHSWMKVQLEKPQSHFDGSKREVIEFPEPQTQFQTPPPCQAR